MEDELFPYQLAGAAWLASKKLALLADEMGIGKTAQAIRACDLIKAERILVICPAVARINWKREFDRFSLYQRNFAVITERKHITDNWSSAICSYDFTQILIQKKSLPTFDCLILDESHYLKTLDTRRTQAILGKKGLVHRANRIWAMSGTPAPNHAGELWPLMFVLRGTQLRYWDFVAKYCTTVVGFRGLQITGTHEERIPELRTMLKPFMLRRKKEEVMKELPPIHYEHLIVEAGPVDLEVQSSFVQYVFPNDRTKELADTLNAQKLLVDNIIRESGLGKDGLRALDGIAKSVSTLRRFTGLQKVQPVVDIIRDELERDVYQKIVIFAIHRDVIEGLRQKLEDFKPVTLYGGTEPDRRQRNIDRFQKVRGVRVFIGNIQAAGVAITLTAANQVLFIEQEWVPGLNAQGAMRCHRIGQTRPVFVRFIGLANSIDEKIAATLKRKTRQLTRIFDGEKKDRGLTELSIENSFQTIK